MFEMPEFWREYLFLPLLNVLVYLYGGPAFGNMGLAIIELTVALRLVLLPLSVIEERNRDKYARVNEQVASLERDFRNDPVRRKERIRDVLKTNRVNHWSKVLLLAVQGVVLVLLYQVFMGGLKRTGFESLYAWVPIPRDINTMFIGYDLTTHNWLWPFACAAVLFFTIYVEMKKRESIVTKSDISYLIFFPLFTFAALAFLPIVKSLFVMSSMLFTQVLHVVRRVLYGAPGQ